MRVHPTAGDDVLDVVASMSSGTAARRRRLLSPVSSLEVAFTLNLVLDEQSGASNDESANALAAKALVATVADVIKDKVDDGSITSDLIANIVAKDPGSTAKVTFSVDKAKSNLKLDTMESTTELVKPIPSPQEPAPGEDGTLLTFILIGVAVCCSVLAFAAAILLLYRKGSDMGRGEGARGSSNADINVGIMPTTSTARSGMHRNLTRDDATAATSTRRGRCTRGTDSATVTAGRRVSSIA
jgi:hypothetical protein